MRTDDARQHDALIYINGRPSPHRATIGFLADCLDLTREKAIMQRSGYVAIVDDDASLCVALTRLLRVHGINCRSYPSARAFLETLPSGIPDCLIVDVNMPEMTGLELQRELLNLGVRIPTIVITASDDRRVETNAVSLGAAAFLHKPVARDKLMAAIISAGRKLN